MNKKQIRKAVRKELNEIYVEKIIDYINSK